MAGGAGPGPAGPREQAGTTGGEAPEVTGAASDVAGEGPLPPELQSMTMYSVGLAVRSADPERAREFIRRLTGFNAQALLIGAGFEVGR